MTINGTKRSMRRVKLAGVTLAVTAALLGAGYDHSATQEAKISEAKAQIASYEQQLQEAQETVQEQDAKVQSLQQDNENLRGKVEELRREVNRGNARAFTVEVTAYDLSEASCNKGMSHPDYGITASGVSLKGQTLESARAIAVDPNIIPLGSKVRLQFDDPKWQHLNGVYTAVDTGGAIKGNHIDLFFGDFQSATPSREAMDFGRRTAKLAVI